jgi:hypothetical protein
MEIGLFHENEADDESAGAEDGTPVQHPLPALSVVDEAGDERGKEGTAS